MAARSLVRLKLVFLLLTRVALTCMTFILLVILHWVLIFKVYLERVSATLNLMVTSLGGDKALRVNESENININSVNAYGFTNITESIVTIEYCDNVNLTDVVAANCEKALTAPATQLSNATGIISVFYCWDTNLLRCHADNNYATNDNVLFGPISVLASI